MFINMCVVMFGIPAYAWIPSALIGFGLGTWLLFSAQSRNRNLGIIILAIALLLLPIFVLSLAPFFGKYIGP